MRLAIRSLMILLIRNFTLKILVEAHLKWIKGELCVVDTYIFIYLDNPGTQELDLEVNELDISSREGLLILTWGKNATQIYSHAERKESEERMELKIKKK